MEKVSIIWQIVADFRQNTLWVLRILMLTFPKIWEFVF